MTAHKQPWAAVGPAIANANPDTILSWASLFTDFGPWVHPAAAGVTSGLAWHHASYKREPLSGYEAEQLESFFETEGFLHQALRERGYQLYFESGAKSNHVNVSSLSSLMRCKFHGGRLYGAARSQFNQWSMARRLLYIAGSPLVPVLRLRQTLREVRRAGQFDKLFPKILPGTITALVAHCLGEITGYAFGAGDAAWRRVSCELSRREFLTESEKRAATPKPPLKSAVF